MPDRHPTDPPIPLSRLGDLNGWRLNIRCGRCGRRAMTAIEPLAEKHGHQLALWRLVARFRCQNLTRRGSRCGGKPDLLTLVQGRERRKDFLVYQEVTVLDDRLRITT